MKFFLVLFVAVLAVSHAYSSEVEAEERDIISMIINMIKGFVCNMQEVEVC